MLGYILEGHAELRTRGACMLICTEADSPRGVCTLGVCCFGGLCVCQYFSLAITHPRRVM